MREVTRFVTEEKDIHQFRSIRRRLHVLLSISVNRINKNGGDIDHAAVGVTGRTVWRIYDMSMWG